MGKLAVVDVEAMDDESLKAHVRREALIELSTMMQTAVDKVRADGKVSDYIAMTAQLSKMAGVDAVKADKYDNLKVINVVIGSNMTMTATVTESDVKDVTPVIDVEDAVIIESKPPDEEAKDLLDAYAMFGSGMVIADD